MSRAAPEPARPSATPPKEAGSQPLEGRGRSWIPVVLVLGGILVAALIYRWTASNDPLPGPPAASASGPSTVEGRCVAVSPADGFVVGTESNLKAPAEPQAPDLDNDSEPDRDDLLAPFAVVLGRATAFADGFALGMLGEAKEGSSAFVVTLSADGTTGKSIKLLRSRADLDPPAVAAVPGQSTVFAAALEPNASGRAIRMARLNGDEIAWGAEIAEGNDESLALDLAVNARRGVVTWDALDGHQSVVHVAGFAVDDFGKLTSTRRATTKEQDADSPRVVATDKGFFLVYLVHGGEIQRDTRSSAAPAGSARPAASSAPEAPSAKPRTTPKPSASAKPKKPHREEDDDAVEIDETKGGESISNSWIEAVPLDESGAQSSDAIRVTPEGVTVISFDVAAGPNGTLLVAYRDDDAPMGGAGGIIRMANVHPGGIGATYESDEPLPSDGVPALLSGWLGVPTLAGSDMLARLGSDGMPAEALVREGSLGRGEPIAAAGDRMLLTEPLGAAMRLRVVACKPTVAPPESGAPRGSADPAPGPSAEPAP